METKANHLLVGVFVLALVAALLGFIMWVVKLDIDRELSRYLIYFQGSVSGLTQASEVHYHGVPVGRVREIRIDPENPEWIRVLVEVGRETPIKADSTASLTFQGITGDRFIEISGGSQASPELAARPGQEYPVIPSAPSDLETVIGGMPKLLERLTALSENAASLLDRGNREAFSGTLRNVEAITGAVAGRSQQIEQLIADASAAASELRAAAETINRLARQANETVTVAQATVEQINDETRAISDEVQTLLADIRDTSTSFKRAGNELQTMIAENREPIRAFSREGLSEFTQLASEARVLVDSLTRLSNQLEINPRGFLFGSAVEEFEAP